ncbi:hypothetical protein ACFLS1_11905, partial [Verrucomicrobiota bacterium]
MTDAKQIFVPPNWAHLLSCCAFVAPIGVAAVQLYHDLYSITQYFEPWVYLDQSLIIHPIVIIVSL